MNSRNFKVLIRCASIFATAITLSASEQAVSAPEENEEMSGGETTVSDATQDAFGFPARNLLEEHRPAFFVGNSFFKQNWVVAPASTAGRDGLGPLFNARSCSACHFKDGRSRPPEAGEPMSTMLLRLSVPGTGPHGEPRGDAVYGGQIQGQAVLDVPPEADVYVEYEAISGRFPDGEEYTLRKPKYAITNLGYGKLSDRAMTSPRIAPAIIGMGLLEAIPERTLRSLADPDDRDGDGISGRINEVWDKVAGKTAIGRFGWKAEQPTVLQQVAGAFVEDMGLTSSLMPDENHTACQSAAAKAPCGKHPEVSDKIFSDVVLYSRTLAVPARRKLTNTTVLLGKQLFAGANCTACHVPMFTTGEHPALPELSHQTIRPYTDLLLHDMGEELADHRPVFSANGREWRTPPLWGLGLISKVNGHTFLLHDGRARNVVEAILWHGGEGEAARENFRRMSRADRDALRAFLDSL